MSAIDIPEPLMAVRFEITKDPKTFSPNFFLTIDQEKIADYRPQTVIDLCLTKKNLDPRKLTDQVIRNLLLLFHFKTPLEELGYRYIKGLRSLEFISLNLSMNLAYYPSHRCIVNTALATYELAIDFNRNYDPDEIMPCFKRMSLAEFLEHLRELEP